MYVNKLYDAKERKDLESKFIQTTFVELRLASLNKNIIIGTIYISLLIINIKLFLIILKEF